LDADRRTNSFFDKMGRADAVKDAMDLGRPCADGAVRTP
jgi:hypothetical protein